MNEAYNFGMPVALIRTLISRRLHCRDIRSSILCMHLFTYSVTHCEAIETTLIQQTSCMYAYIFKGGSAGLEAFADFEP